MSLLDTLPLEIIFRIIELAPSTDAISLMRTCKLYYSFQLDPNYWKKRCKCQEIEKKEWLSWKGSCLDYDTKKGYIGKGSENFTSIFSCIDISYREGNEDLLIYFLRVLLREKRMCYHHILFSLPNVTPYGVYLMNLLKRCIIDSRENTFFSIYSLFDKGKFKGDLALYTLAKLRGLERIRQVLITSSDSLEWIFYAIQTRDRLIFDKIYTKLKGSKLAKVTHLIQHVYTWPEVEPLLCNTTEDGNIMDEEICVELKIPRIEEVENKEYTGLLYDLISYNHERARERLSLCNPITEIRNSCLNNETRRTLGVRALHETIKYNIYFLTIPSLS